MQVVRRLVRHPLIRQQGKYFIVSGISVVLDFGVANLLAFAVGVGNVVANAVAVAVVSVANFGLNRAWTFRLRGKVDVAREVVPFVAVAAAVAGLTSAVIWAAEAWFGGGALVFNLAKLAGVGLIWIAKFFVFRHWVFVDRTAAQPD